MQLHVGTATLRGNLRAYASRFNLLELRAERGRLPRPARLRTMATEAPEGFVFSLVLPKVVATLEPSASADEELAFALEAAEAVGASWLVLRTEASVMPSSRSERALAELVAKLPRTQRLAWEPRGLWEAERADGVARDLDLALVRDVSREPAAPGNEVYARLRALGRSSLSLGALERAAEELIDRERAFVVLEGERAVAGAKTLRELCAELGGEAEAS